MKRTALGLCLLFLLSTALAYAEETLKLGVIVPLTGAQKKFGELMKAGCLIAQEEVNAAGLTTGVFKGKKIEIVFEDSESKPEKAAELAEKLAGAYPIVLGGYSSSEGMKIGEALQKSGLPYLCSIPSTDKLTQAGWKNVFRINPCASQYTLGLQELLLASIKPQTMAIVYEDTDYGKSLSEAMRKFCAKENIKIVYDSSYKATSADYRPMLLEMKIQNPDAVFMVSYLMDAILLMKQSRELGIAPKIFAGGAAGFALPEFVKASGEAAEGVITADLWAPDVKYPGVKEFVEKFRAGYGEPTYHAAEGYALIKVAADALSRANTASKDDLIAALKASDLTTVFGPVKFQDYDNFTNQNKVPTIVRQVKRGSLVTVWPKEIAVEEFSAPAAK